MPIIEKINQSIYQERRKRLKELIGQKYPDAQAGIIMVCAGFENDEHVFKQESSFYYFTGIEEPATVLMIDIEQNKTTFFIPNFGKERAKWVITELSIDTNPALFGADAIDYLGEPCKGYQCHPFFEEHQYQNLLTILKKYSVAQKPIFTLNPSMGDAYSEQRFMLQRVSGMIPGFSNCLHDISSFVAQMRRKKSHEELDFLYKAIGITMEAHDAVMQSLEADKYEYEMQALLEYVFTGLGGSVAFPSIVASGKHGAILHYHHNNAQMRKGDLVVVDIGTRYNYYCADLTRTYPVSGVFTKRQQELYNIVLETQEYIANIAQPGYWLSNAQHKEKSLHHLAVAFLQEKGFAHYFTHGIGHFLGIDVHDVGDYKEPLQVGDVITIEPGIYMPEENIGIRIEDNYWIAENGAICLSEDLPKEIEDIEEAMKKK